MKKKLVKMMYHATCESEPEGKPGSCPYRKYGRCGEIERLDMCAITHLAEELLANGVTVQQWIPVAESLPDDWTDVLVLLQCGDCTVAVKSGHIWRERWTNTRLDRDPTHWMPLPQQPKEG